MASADVSFTCATQITVLRGVQLSDIERLREDESDYFYKENKETGMALIFFPLKTLSLLIFSEREGRPLISRRCQSHHGTVQSSGKHVGATTQLSAFQLKQWT